MKLDLKLVDEATFRAVHEVRQFSEEDVKKIYQPFYRVSPCAERDGFYLTRTHEYCLPIFIPSRLPRYKNGAPLDLVKPYEVGKEMVAEVLKFPTSMRTTYLFGQLQLDEKLGPTFTARHYLLRTEWTDILVQRYWDQRQSLDSQALSRSPVGARLFTTNDYGGYGVDTMVFSLENYVCLKVFGGGCRAEQMAVLEHSALEIARFDREKPLYRECFQRLTRHLTLDQEAQYKFEYTDDALCFVEQIAYRTAERHAPRFDRNGLAWFTDWICEHFDPIDWVEIIDENLRIINKAESKKEE